MWYWIVFALVALWIVRDGWARKIQPGWMVAAVVGAVILGPVAVPLYFALRPLKAGEVREGGRVWHVCRHFTLWWTVLVAGTFIQLLMDPRSVIAGAIGLSIVLGLVWFVPVIIALSVGIVMKNSAIIERGPTGRTEW